MGAVIRWNDPSLCDKFGAQRIADDQAELQIGCHTKPSAKLHKADLAIEEVRSGRTHAEIDGRISRLWENWESRREETRWKEVDKVREAGEAS